MRNIILIALSVFCIYSCGENQEPGYTEDDGWVFPEDENLHLNEPFFSASLPGANSISAFSEYVQVGDMYFLAGKIGRDPETQELAEGGIQGETRQTIKNIEDVLVKNGMKLTDVVKATVILDNIKDFAAFNEVFMEEFPQKPARTTFAAEALAVGALIEIEVIAIKKPLPGN